jgi:hypothetical protein
MLMRGWLKTALVFLAICAGPYNCWAQQLPFGLVADGRVCMEYLFGRQTIRPYVTAEAAAIAFATLGEHHHHHQHYQFTLDPKFPVIDAELELSTWIPVSVRGVTMVSLAKPQVTSHRSIHSHQGLVDSASSWDISGSFVAWEVAGLYHLWSGGGYRFSFLAGFRNEEWFNSGSLKTDTIPGSFLQERFTTQMPFLGLQTSMGMPWWSARFEFIASPFMLKKADGTWRESTLYAIYEGKAGQGGGVKFRTSGAVRIWPRVSIGLDSQVSYQGLKGEIQTSDNQHVQAGQIQKFDLDLSETYVSVGATIQCEF